MIYITGLLQFIFILYATIYEYKKESSSVFMWAVLLVIFGLPHFLYSFRIIDINYDDSTLIIAAFFVILFTLLYILTRRISGKSKYKEKLIVTSIKRSCKMERILLTLLFIIVLTSLYDAYQYSGGLLNTSWGMRRGDENIERSLISRLLSSFKYAAGSIILIYIVYKEKKIKLFIPILLIILYSIISRRRIDMLPIIVSIIASFILLKNKVTFKHILILILIGSVAVYSIYAMQIFRYGGSIESFITQYDGNWRLFHYRVSERIFSGEGELGLQKAFYFFIEKDNNYPGFGEGHTYIRMLMFFIPTDFAFGLKPPDFALTMGSFWNPNAGQGYSMHPTLFGDVYANFGFLGILMGIFWGLFSNLIDILLIRNRDSYFFPLYLTFSSCFIIIGRGSVYNGFYVMSIVFILLYLLKKIRNVTIL